MFKDVWISISILILLVMSLIILKSIAPGLFPLYFVYIFISILAFWLFSQIDFDVISLFSNHFYIISIAFLLLTFVIGKVTRGTFRFLPIGDLSLQPAELVRPFLLVFFANYLGKGKLYLKKILIAVLLLAIPVFLILVQPSLGVSILTTVGFFGVLMSSNFDKKYIFAGLGIVVVAIPIFWKIMAPYQRQRVLTFLSPASDPLGAGYNSLQSTIAAGSGKFIGRGLGHGIQTQLAFLPEKQTDFIFAATGEELGFFGAGLLLFMTFLILFRLAGHLEHTVGPPARAYLSGFLLTYLVQVFVHVGMNLGMLPVTGLPYPLVSAGGSSLLGTMVGLGIALGAFRSSTKPSLPQP